MKTLVVLIFLFIFFTTNSFSQVVQSEKFDKSKWIANVDTVITNLMKKYSIPGLSLAVIKDGKIDFLNSYGIKDIETKEPVTNSTIFNAASLTKPIFAYLVLKLHDEGKLNIDVPLYKYIPKEILEENFIGHSIDKEGFKYEEFKKITGRIVLSHTTGLPMYQRTDPLEISFEPGTQFRYSPFSYSLLEIAVLSVMGIEADSYSGTELNDLTKQYVFEPLKMTESSLIWEDQFEETAAVGHTTFNLSTGEFMKIKKANGQASLYTTAKDYARFFIAVMNGEGLKEETSVDMLRSQIKLNEEDNFWGLGVGLENTHEGNYFWQFGDFGIFKNLALASTSLKNGIVYLSNSYYGLCPAEEIVNLTIGGQHPLFESSLMKNYVGPIKKWVHVFFIDGLEAGLKLYHSEKVNKPNPISEGFLIAIGYEFMRVERYKDAVKIFTIATNDYPTSSNAFYSLAEAYREDDNDELALQNYEKSLQLNPKNKKAEDAIKKLK